MIVDWEDPDMMEQNLRVDVASTIRMLAADAVETANSGHQGAPMGQADLAFVLWDEFLRFDPQDPDWVGRDRFIPLVWACIYVAICTPSSLWMRS